MSIVYINSIILDQTFLNNQKIINVNCKNRPWVENSMYGAFYNSRTVQSVTNINNSVTNMSLAFQDCKNLKSTPVLPSSVTTLHSCFVNCTNLTSTPSTIPNSVTDLSSAFYGCYNITQVNPIPNSVTNMEGTFYACSNITSISTLPNHVTDLAYAFVGTKITTSPEIPNSVTNLYGTFGNCLELTTAPTIPNSVSDLPLTFMFDSKLAYIPNIPDSITNLTRTFMLCENISWFPTNNTLSSNLETMNLTFAKCTNITNGPDLINCTKLTNMYDTFQNCWKLEKTPMIPDSVVQMPGTFAGCNNLYKITNLPPNLINMGAGGNDLIPETSNQHVIGSGCFSYCTNLTDINIPIIPQSVKDMCGTFAGCTLITNAPVLPASVINTAECFMNCENLIKTTAIPTNVTNVQNMFAGCINLTGDIYVSSNKIQDASNCFNGTSLIKNLYIPFKNSDDSYSATYNTFKNAGYNETTRKDGILLIDLADSKILTIDPNIKPNEIIIEYNGNTITQSMGASVSIPNNTLVNYIALAPGYLVQRDSIIINAHTALNPNLEKSSGTYTVTYDDTYYQAYNIYTHLNIQGSTKESANLASDIIIQKVN